MTEGIFASLREVDVPDYLSYLGVTFKDNGTDNVNIQTCPVCGRSKWKTRFSKEKRTGLCFHASCGAHFNLFSFTMAYINGGDVETFAMLEDYLSRSGVTYKSTRRVIKAAYDWNLPASIPLPIGDKTHPMLIKRKILSSTQQAFGLRYCKEGYYDYVDHEGEKRRQTFNDRIIIPVADLDGSVKTFQGRACWDVDEEAGEKRYLFPIGLPGSSHFLYGGHLVKGKKRLLLVEGPFDCMAAYQAISGHPDFADMGVVGTFGLSVGSSDETGDDQLGRLRKLMEDGLKEVVFMWDAEKNAYDRALKASLVVRKAGLKSFVAVLPAGADPNEVETRVVRDAIVAAKEVTRLNYARMKSANPFEE